MPISGVTSTTGSGSRVATIDPILGMKLSRKAISPKAIARSMPSAPSMPPTTTPVTAERMNLKTMKRFTRRSTSPHVPPTGPSRVDPPSSRNNRKTRTMAPCDTRLMIALVRLSATVLIAFRGSRIDLVGVDAVFLQR